MQLSKGTKRGLSHAYARRLPCTGIG